MKYLKIYERWVHDMRFLEPYELKRFKFKIGDYVKMDPDFVKCLIFIG